MLHFFCRFCLVALETGKPKLPPVLYRGESSRAPTQAGTLRRDAATVPLCSCRLRQGSRHCPSLLKTTVLRFPPASPQLPPKRSLGTCCFRFL